VTTLMSLAVMVGGLLIVRSIAKRRKLVN
jgi:putative spermidine/putrescine transport system permease protein